MEFKSDVLNSFIEIKDIDPNDADNWKTIKSESYRPDKEQYVLDKFKEDFPNQKISSYKLLTSTASRNAALLNWLTNTNLIYSKDVEVPRYLTEVINADEYKTLEGKILSYNGILSSQAKELQNAAIKYNKEISEINSKFKVEKDRITKDPIVKVLTMNQTDLPLTLSLQIENFTPSTNDNAPTRKAYAREVLINYQLVLIKIIKENENLDIDELIKELNVK